MPVPGGSLSSGFSSVVGGFQGRSEEIRKENQAKEATQQARDTKIFELLANSDDPDIRASAVTGLLTGNHPARGLDKWFGAVGDHPVYEKIKGLVNEGHQPFYGREKLSEIASNQAGETTKQQLKGRLTGANEAVTEITGEGMPEENINRAAMGMLGAAPPVKPLLTKTVEYLDENGARQTAGVMQNQMTGEFTHLDGSPFEYGDSVTKVSNTNGSFGGAGGAGADPNKHGQWIFKADHPGSTTGTKQFFTAEGAPVGQPVRATQGTPPNMTPVYTGGGIAGFDPRNNSLSPTAGGAGMGRAEAPSENVSTLRALASDIERRIPRPKNFVTNQPVSDPADPRMAQWKTQVDAEAVKLGYQSYDALIQAIGGAAQQVGGSVPPGIGTPPPAAPASAAPGGPPPAAPQAPGAARGAKPTPGAKPAGGALDIDAILKAAEANRKRSGG